MTTSAAFGVSDNCLSADAIWLGCQLILAPLKPESEGSSHESPDDDYTVPLIRDV